MKTPRLRAFRWARGLSQDALAELAGVHRVTVSRLETGHDGFRPTIQKLAAALGVPREHLVGAAADSPTTRACPQCYRPFAPLDNRAVYCSSACRQLAYRERKARGMVPNTVGGERRS